MGIAAGKLDRRLTFLEKTSQSDGAGGLTNVQWRTLFTCYAEYIPLRAQQQFDAGALVSLVTVQFRIRYRSGVTSALRVSCDGITYQIQGVQEQGRRDALLISCQQIKPGAV